GRGGERGGAEGARQPQLVLRGHGPVSVIGTGPTPAQARLNKVHAVQKKTVTPARTPIGLPGVKWVGPGGGARALAGLAEAGARGIAALHLPPDAGVVLELRLAPAGVGEVQQLDAELD